MKKFLVVLLACAMIFGFASTAMAADTQITEFNDIADQSVAARNAIMKLAVLGVIEGNEGIGGAYRPADNLTRAEFAKIVCYLTGNVKIADSLASVGSRFTDVSTGNWYTGWVNAAAQSGYFVGDPGGTFRPNANITMQEVVAVALRAAGYTDKLPGNWPGNYVTKAQNVGLLDNVTFVGSAAATRSDMAVICEAVLGINMVAHIDSEIAFGLSLAQGTADPDGFSEIYYISNETYRQQTYETILHKAFKGEYWDLQVNPGIAYSAAVDGVVSPTLEWDESNGWYYEDYSSSELALNLNDSWVFFNEKSKNKTFDEWYTRTAREWNEDRNIWEDVTAPSAYSNAEALASTYYITREFDLAELAGMQVQVTVIDEKEICFVDVVSSYALADSIHQDRAKTSTTMAQNIVVDGKSLRPSTTMGVNNRMANIDDYAYNYYVWNSTDGVAERLLNLRDSNNDDDFPGKLYLDKDGRVYGVKNYDAYDRTSFGIFDDIDSSRVNWKESYLGLGNSDTLKIDTGKPYTLYKDGEFIKAEDLDENDLVSRLGHPDSIPFFYATSPQEGELTAHNRFNNRLTLGGTAYRTINPSGFQYSDDGGETFGPYDLTDITKEIDFGEAEFAKAYNFSKAGYVAANLTNQKVIGVITKIQPTQIFSSGQRMERFEEITIYNAEGKEVTYKFHKDFRDGYTWYVNDGGFYPALAGQFKVETDGPKKWTAARTLIAGSENISRQLIAGDIIQLVLDKSDNVKRVANYAKYDISTPNNFDVRVTSSNSRIILQGGTYTLNKDATVFNVTSDNKGDYDDVSIQSVASVLAKDFKAAKAVAFDVKTGANVNALYIIGDISVYQFGILTGWGTDSGGDYYTINGQKVYVAANLRPARYTVVSYIVSGGEATLTALPGSLNGEYLATKGGVVSNLSTIVGNLKNDNIKAVAGVAKSYRTGTRALEIAPNSYVYITDSTYIYDLIDEKVVEAADLINSSNPKTVIAFYDRDGNAEFVARIGGGDIGGAFDTTPVTLATIATELNISDIATAVSDDDGVVVASVNSATPKQIVLTPVAQGTAIVTVKNTGGAQEAKIEVSVANDGTIRTTLVPRFNAAPTTQTAANTALGFGANLIANAVSSNDNVATVAIDANGQGITITPVGVGSATITVSSVTGQQAMVDITVDAKGNNTASVRAYGVTTITLANLASDNIPEIAKQPVFGADSTHADYAPTEVANYRFAYTPAIWEAAKLSAGNFNAVGDITRTITLTAVAGFSFAGTNITAADLAGMLPEAKSVSVSGTPGTTLVIVATYTVAPEVILAAGLGTDSDISAFPLTTVLANTLTAPAVDATGADYTAAGAWSGLTAGAFVSGTPAVYTITLTPNPGYTFTGTDIESDGSDFTNLSSQSSIAVTVVDGKLVITLTYNVV